MKIAVTSQNRKTITEHAGRCRKFWIFEIENNQIVASNLIELSKEQSFHDSSPHNDHPLDDIEVLITGSMGQGLIMRLERKGIKGLITKETDPKQAILLYLKGALETEKPHHHHKENNGIGNKIV